MSSARSITAARARRAGETPAAQNPIINRGNNNVVNKGRIAPQPQQQIQRPIQPQQQIQRPIQQQQQPQQQQNYGSQRQPVRPIQQPQQQYQEYDQNQNDQGYDDISQPRIPNPKGKITIGDAIGLITIRLGRVEQYIQQLQEEGQLNGEEEDGSGNVGQVLGVDSSVFKSIVDRLDKLESKQTQPPQQQQKDVVDRLEKELKETKDLLMMVVLKHEKHTGESSIKFDTIDSRVVYVEDKVKSLEEDMENVCGDINNLYLQKQNSDVTDSINDNESDFKASSVITEHSNTQGQNIELEYSSDKESEDISKRMYVPVDNDLDLDSNDGLQGLDVISNTGTYLQEQNNDISNSINQLSGQYKSNSFTYDPNIIQ
jgi:hypothetical protein